jgi:hypothetical protein
VDQSQQDMLGADEVVTQRPGFFLGLNADQSRPVSESLEHA